VDPPLEQTELQRLQMSITLPLPEALRQFWLTGSRHCACRYICRDAKGHAQLFGGPAFLDAQELPEHLLVCHDWAENTWISEYPEEQRYWLNAIPFLHMDNGDYLGLDMSQGQEDPPVVYLSHDEQTFVLARSFTAFLEQWQQLSYIGPESWMLEGLRNEEGLLDASTPAAQHVLASLGQSSASGVLIRVPSPPGGPTESEPLEECMDHLRGISTAVWMQCGDRLPDAESWYEALNLSQAIGACPSGGPAYGYAMNQNLSNAWLSAIREPHRTVLFFESDLGRINAHDSGESLPSPGRHSGRNVFVFVDSHIEVLDQEGQQEVKWTAD